MKSPAAEPFLRRLAGSIAVTLLRGIAALPAPVARTTGNSLLPLYLLFRSRTRARLRHLSGREPGGAPLRYYRLRLRLALLSLRHLLRKPDGCTIRIEGRELYEAALRSGKPVALFGWHQGPVELLHRVPHEAPEAAGRAAFLVTAKAFAPALTKLMRRGRANADKEILNPGSMEGLRRWEKQRGILALMIDQVPGAPAEWISICDGRLEIPYPGRLVEWVFARDAVFLAVSVRWIQGAGEGEAFFRYHALDASQPLKPALARLLQQAIGETPEAYNFSYPKIRVIDYDTNTDIR